MVVYGNGNVLSYHVLCSEGFVWCREVVCADVTQIVVLVSHVNAGWTAVLGGAVTQSKVKVLLYKLKSEEISLWKNLKDTLSSSGLSYVL